MLIGYDLAAARFVEAALAGNYRLAAYVDVPSPLDPPSFPGVRRLASVEALAEVGTAGFFVLSGSIAGRADRLRSVLRLDPVDLVISLPLGDEPDIYYELLLVRRETGVRVLPLFPDAGHPGLAAMRELMSKSRPIPSLQWMEWTLPFEKADVGMFRFLHGWPWFIEFAGDLLSVSATGSSEDPQTAARVQVTANTAAGALATVRWLDNSAIPYRFHLEADPAIDCLLRDGWDGPAEFRWLASGKEEVRQIPVAPLGERWLAAWESLDTAGSDSLCKLATRQFELAEAVQRSLTKHRAVALTYDEISEEAGFKSVMASTGCGLVWALLLLVILAGAGVPFVQYLAAPVLLVFLLLQLFGLGFRKEVAPEKQPNASSERQAGA